MTSLIDLPEDILAIVFEHCPPREFLALCRTCKGLFQFKQDPAYWRTTTSDTFRLPISPLLKADGARWYHLYKRLKTQTRLFIWGQGITGNLGRGVPTLRRGPRPVGGRHPAVQPWNKVISSWPTNTQIPDEIKVIADLQCGGWSTSILSSEGRVYVTGIINSMDGRYNGEATENFAQLNYRDRDSTAIRQFSSGRWHILAITDSGDILSWDRLNAEGCKIFPRSSSDFGGRPIRVVAGWAESSAYIPETGIVYWSPVNNVTTGDEALWTRNIFERIIPGTARYVDGKDTGIDIVSHVVLENYIVWVTSESRVYACATRVKDDEDTQPTNPPFEVPGYNTAARSAQHVQGQYDTFAVFTDTGEVLAGKVPYLDRCHYRAQHHRNLEDGSYTLPPSAWSGLDELISTRPPDSPVLQHSQVISLAFGDHHYHALHANGRVTVHGHEPVSCGACGLGDRPSGNRFRGMETGGMLGQDSKLMPAAEQRGREVWFEPEKRDWLAWMEETLRDNKFKDDELDENGIARPAIHQFLHHSKKRFVFSEWVEQEGRNWDKGPADASSSPLSDEEQKPTPTQHEDFHLDSFFTISIAAAGWHSGALVLVDDEKAHETRQKWIVPPASSSEDELSQKFHNMPGHFQSDPKDHEEEYIWKAQGFPRVQMPDGTYLPGVGEPRPWREGPPSVDELEWTD